MDLDEMKNRVKGAQAQVSEPQRGSERGIDDLISRLKRQDEHDRVQVRRTTIAFAVAGIFYAGVFGLTWFAPPDDSPALHRVILGLFAAVFLSAGLYGRMKGREIAATDYAAPAQIFLAKAGERFAFLRAKDLVVVIPYLLILSITCTVAVMTSMGRYLPSVDPSFWLLGCSVGIPVLWLVGFGLGWRKWKKGKEPLLDEIRGMERELREA